MEDLLQLNDTTLVAYRVSTLKIVELAQFALRQYVVQEADCWRAFKEGVFSQTELDDELARLFVERATAQAIIGAQTGETALTALPNSRNGLVLYT